MRTIGALPLAATCLIAFAWVPERADAQYALDRLFLDTSNLTPLNEALSFNSETAVANFYGENSPEASLASEFYDGYSGSSANMLFARYPVGGARARLYGSNVSDLTLSELRAVNGQLSLTSQGYNFSASVNLSGVKGFYAAAASIQNALDQNLPVGAVTTGSSITPVSLALTGSVTAGILTVTSASPGSIQDGGYINGSGIRTGTQVVAQLSGTPGGVGTYSVFYWPGEASVPSETIKESYGKLTIGSVTSGTVAIGQQVTSAGGVLSDSAIQANLSGSGAGSTWVVNLSQRAAAQNMTMTAAPLDVTYNPVSGGTKKTGSFWIEQQGNFTYASSSLTYAAPGTAARTLGLTKAIGAYLSSPGEDVMSPSEWMNNIIQENDQFASFQTTFAPDPGTVDSLEAWAQSSGYQYLEGYTTTTPPIVDSELNAGLLSTAAGAMTAQAPEPSTWAMMLLGLGSLGLVRFRIRPLAGPSVRRPLAQSVR